MSLSPISDIQHIYDNLVDNVLRHSAVGCGGQNKLNLFIQCPRLDVGFRHLCIGCADNHCPVPGDSKQNTTTRCFLGRALQDQLLEQ